MQRLLAVEVALAREPQVVHRLRERVEVPVVQVRMQLERERGLDVVLRLEVHLRMPVA